MRVIATETVIVKPELIRLVRRDDSKKWQAHYKLENLKTWFRRSTDTANVKEASKIAERMWMKATFDFEEVTCRLIGMRAVLNSFRYSSIS